MLSQELNLYLFLGNNRTIVDEKSEPEPPNLTYIDIEPCSYILCISNVL